MTASTKLFAPKPSAPSDMEPPSYAQIAAEDKVPVSTFKNLGGKIDQELETHYNAALAQLREMGAAKLGGKFQVALALDISRSMQHINRFFYNPEEKTPEGQFPLQQLINQALSMGYLLDDESFVNLFPFGDQAYGPVKITKDNYKTVTEHFYRENNPATKTTAVDYLKDHTDYTAAVHAVTDFYTRGKTKQEIAKMDPVFVIFVTDGSPNPMTKDELVQPHDAKAEFQPYPYPCAKSRNMTEALDEIQKAFARTSQLPIFFVVIGFEGLALEKVPKEEQFLELKEAAEHYKKDKDKIPQNIELLLLDHPEDLEMHDFISKLPHWLIQAYNQKITSLDMHDLMDMKKFNAYQNRFKSCWARFSCCAVAEEYQLVHHGHHHEVMHAHQHR